jgi:hypothetical protein
LKGRDFQSRRKSPKKLIAASAMQFLPDNLKNSPNIWITVEERPFRAA